MSMKKNISDSLVIAGIGEVLWDVVADIETLGGAPINFAYHAAQLGATALAISSVGDDERGKRAVSTLAKRGLATAHLTIIEGAETGYVQASVDPDGVASYVFPDEVAWDRIRIDSRTMSLVPQLDAVCFGSLAQRSVQSRSAIQRFLDSLQSTVLKVFDLNIRQSYYSTEVIRGSLEQANVLKLNDEEIIMLARQEDLQGSVEAKLRLLVERYRLSLAVLTRGGHGSLLVSPTAISDHPGYQTKVVDTIGAGDSFTAVTAVGVLRGYSLDVINERANRVAAHVCSRRGAMVPLPEELRKF